MSGGFWSIIRAAQTPGAPVLRIVNTGTNAVAVVWPSTSTAFVLQQNTDLNTTNWESPPETINDDGTHKFITVNPPTANTFYRLHKP